MSFISNEKGSIVNSTWIMKVNKWVRERHSHIMRCSECLPWVAGCQREASPSWIKHSPTQRVERWIAGVPHWDCWLTFNNNSLERRETWFVGECQLMGCLMKESRNNHDNKWRVAAVCRWMPSHTKGARVQTVAIQMTERDRQDEEREIKVALVRLNGGASMVTPILPTTSSQAMLLAILNQLIFHDDNEDGHWLTTAVAQR